MPCLSQLDLMHLSLRTKSRILRRILRPRLHRPVSAALPNLLVTRHKHAHHVLTKSNSPFRKHLPRSPSSRTSNLPPRVTTVKALVVSAAQGNPQQTLKDKGVINSRCSRHMTGNMSYLSDFKGLLRGYVAFGGNPKGGNITGKGRIKAGKLDFDDVYFVKELKFNLFSVSQMCEKKNSVLFTDTECLGLSPNFKLPDESQVLLRVPRENNMYNVNLKNIVPFGDLTCLFAKATIDESNVWHRRLGHINFKTLNKLVKGNLVKGLPTKVFENDHSCLAYKKAKQHKASCTGPTWLFDIDSLSETMNYHPVTVGNQTNSGAGFQDTFKAEKAGEEVAPTYMLFPVWSDGSTNPQNNDIDALFDRKEHDEFKDCSNNSSNEVNAAGSSIPTVEHPFINNTNIFSADGPSNTTVSPTYEKSSFIDDSTSPHDPDMPDLDDINYSNDEDAIGAEADLNNLESSIPVSLIPTTKIHKDHPISQIIGDLSLTIQTRSMARVVKDQGGLSQMFNKDFDTCIFSCFLSQEEPKKCKKQTVVATSSTEAGYVAAASGYA
nr:ribonuclease H-like domain-containing protein [Tanacetum cinerariifolium]